MQILNEKEIVNIAGGRLARCLNRYFDPNKTPAVDVCCPFGAETFAAHYIDSGELAASGPCTKEYLADTVCLDNLKTKIQSGMHYPLFDRGASFHPYS